MNCQSAGSYPGSHAGERPATVLVTYSTGMQEAACDACARYWVNLRPTQTWIAPLSSYVDHFAQAKAQLDAHEAANAERKSLEALQAVLLTSCPEEILRRLAAGEPTPDDWCVIDRLAGLSEAQVNSKLESGFYGRILAKIASNTAAGIPSQGPVMAQEAMRARRLAPGPQQAIAGAVVSSHRAAHAKLPAGKRQQSGRSRDYGLFTSVSMLVGLGLTAAGLPDGTQIGSQPDLPVLLTGLALLLGPIIFWVIVFLSVIGEGHREALSGLTPQQRKTVHHGELIAGMAAVDLGLRAANHHADKNIARAQEAKQRRRAEAEGQRQHQELLDAIQQTGQAGAAPANDALTRNRDSATSQYGRSQRGTTW